MTTTDAIIVTLQLASASVVVVGGVYFLAGDAESLPYRVAIGILALVCAAVLLGLSEVVSVLNDIRAVVEGETAVQGKRLRGRKSPAAQRVTPQTSAIPET